MGHFQKISGAETSSLEVPCSATIASLFQAVCELEACDAGSIALLLGEEPLPTIANGAVLSDCGVVDGTTLTLVRKTIRKILTASDDRTAKFWDRSTGKCYRTFSGHSLGIKSAVFSSDGSSILTASNDKTARIWDSCTGQCKQIFSGHTGYVNSAVFSANGTWVLTASNDATCKIWDSCTGELTKTICGHSDIVRSAVFSEDGWLVLTAS